MLGHPWAACRAPRTRIGARREAGRWLATQGVEAKGTKRRRGQRAQARLRWPAPESSRRPRATINCRQFPAQRGVAPPRPAERAGPGCGVGTLKPSERRLGARAPTGPIPPQPQRRAGVVRPPQGRAGEQVERWPWPNAWLLAPSLAHATPRRTSSPPLRDSAAAVSVDRFHGFRRQRFRVHRLRCHRCGRPGSARMEREARSTVRVRGTQSRDVGTCSGNPPLPARAKR